MVLLVLLVAVSLSMDTFSLSLVYGTLNMIKKQKYTLSMIVGIFHFFMPLIGMFIGSYILSFIKINPEIVVGIILIFIGFQMFIETLKEEIEIKGLKIIDFILFAFAVSIDSFSVGISLKTIYENYLFSVSSFAICSFLFTWFGLAIGNKVQKSLGKYATMIGGIILVIVGMFYIL